MQAVGPATKGARRTRNQHRQGLSRIVKWSRRRVLVSLSSLGGRRGGRARASRVKAGEDKKMYLVAVFSRQLLPWPDYRVARAGACR